ncbi:hypothetical protein, partial [Mycobacterium sp. E2497]|uniref:hypothetical protein n=1 Tax=Mycobacterium sp. E2497 TaxID=1834135 RepID=UPI001E289388
SARVPRALSAGSRARPGGPAAGRAAATGHAPGDDVPAFPIRDGADPHHPTAAAGTLRTWRATAPARTLGGDGMSGEEVAWANTVGSGLIPKRSIG